MMESEDLQTLKAGIRRRREGNEKRSRTSGTPTTSYLRELVWGGLSLNVSVGEGGS